MPSKCLLQPPIHNFLQTRLARAFSTYKVPVLDVVTFYMKKPKIVWKLRARS